MEKDLADRRTYDKESVVYNCEDKLRVIEPEEAVIGLNQRDANDHRVLVLNLKSHPGDYDLQFCPKHQHQLSNQTKNDHNNDKSIILITKVRL